MLKKKYARLMTLPIMGFALTFSSEVWGQMNYDSSTFQPDCYNVSSSNMADLCYVLVASRGSGVDCLDCTVRSMREPSGWETLVEGLGAVAGPIAHVIAENSKWTAIKRSNQAMARAHSDSYGHMKEAYMNHSNNCRGALTDYHSFLQNYATLPGITPGEQTDFIAACNGSAMNMFAGMNGLMPNGYGGMGNPMWAAGFTPGFMQGMMGPNWGPGIYPQGGNSWNFGLGLDYNQGNLGIGLNLGMNQMYPGMINPGMASNMPGMMNPGYILPGQLSLSSYPVAPTMPFPMNNFNTIPGQGQYMYPGGGMWAPGGGSYWNNTGAWQQQQALIAQQQQAQQSIWNQYMTQHSYQTAASNRAMQDGAGASMAVAALAENYVNAGQNLQQGMYQQYYNNGMYNSYNTTYMPTYPGAYSLPYSPRGMAMQFNLSAGNGHYYGY